jgi:hypothetical protein
MTLQETIQALCDRAVVAVNSESQDEYRGSMAFFKDREMNFMAVIFDTTGSDELTCYQVVGQHHTVESDYLIDFTAPIEESDLTNLNFTGLIDDLAHIGYRPLVTWVDNINSARDYDRMSAEGIEVWGSEVPGLVSSYDEEFELKSAELTCQTDGKAYLLVDFKGGSNDRAILKMINNAREFHPKLDDLQLETVAKDVLNGWLDDHKDGLDIDSLLSEV